MLQQQHPVKMKKGIPHLFPWVYVVGLLNVLGLQFALCVCLKFSACNALVTAKICTYVDSVY